MSYIDSTINQSKNRYNECIEIFFILLLPVQFIQCIFLLKMFNINLVFVQNNCFKINNFVLLLMTEHVVWDFDLVGFKRKYNVKDLISKIVLLHFF